MDRKGNDAPLRKLASAEDLRGKKSGDHKDGHGKIGRASCRERV